MAATMQETALAKIMIVDDSRIIRRKIARCLEEHELEVIGRASNGVEAVEIFKQARPDIVTMDLTMPEMDGIECIEQLVNLDPSVKILVVSALADKATAIEALRKGANGFLCKPFTDRELSDALSELLRS
jgi:two-component system chemotaxis response regulator CheY